MHRSGRSGNFARTWVEIWDKDFEKDFIWTRKLRFDFDKVYKGFDEAGTFSDTTTIPPSHN